MGCASSNSAATAVPPSKLPTSAPAIQTADTRANDAKGDNNKTNAQSNKPQPSSCENTPSKESQDDSRSMISTPSAASPDRGYQQRPVPDTPMSDESLDLSAMSSQQDTPVITRSHPNTKMHHMDHSQRHDQPANPATPLAINTADDALVLSPISPVPYSPDGNSMDGNSLMMDNTYSSITPPRRFTVDPNKPKGTVDFQTMLNNVRIMELIELAVVTEDRLYELFLVYDEDNDGLICESEVQDIIYLAEVSFSHSNPASPSNYTPEKSLPSIHLDETTFLDSPLPSTSTSPMPNLMQSRPAGPTRKPTNKLKPKLMHNPTPRQSMGTLDDFADDPSPVKALPPTLEVDTTLPPPPVVEGETKPEDLLAPEDIPQAKKGFLKVSEPNSPSRANNKYHVLDAGVLYHMDSLNSVGRMGMNRRGISLSGRSVRITEGNVIELALGDEEETVERVKSEPKVVTIEVRNECEREEWMQAIHEHIDLYRKMPERASSLTKQQQ